MPGQKRVSEDVGKMVHPDNSALLTYIGQPFPDKARSNVHQHLAQCEPCQLRYGELKSTADLLTETLAHFDDVQYYPPLTEKVFKSIHNPAAARLVRRRRWKGRLREGLALGYALLGHALGEVKTVVLYPLVPLLFLLKSRQQKQRNMAMASIPVAAIPAVLFLVLLAVFVVLASNSENLKHFHSFEVTSEVTSTSVVQSTPSIVPHSAATPITPTAKPVKALPAFPETTVTATPGPPKPTLSLCSPTSDKAQRRIRFCGSNFTAGSQVQLVVTFAFSQSKFKLLVPVNAKGIFQISWIASDCKFVPLSIYAQDVTPGHTAEISQILQDIQFLNCNSPAATSTAAGWHTTH